MGDREGKQARVFGPSFRPEFLSTQPRFSGFKPYSEEDQAKLQKAKEEAQRRENLRRWQAREPP